MDIKVEGHLKIISGPYLADLSEGPPQIRQSSTLETNLAVTDGLTRSLGTDGRPPILYGQAD